VGFFLELVHDVEGISSFSGDGGSCLVGWERKGGKEGGREGGSKWVSSLSLCTMWRVSPPSAAREAAAWSAKRGREGGREGGRRKSTCRYQYVRRE